MPGGNLSSSILIRGGCVLTLGARTPNLEQGDVLIDEGRIVEVAPEYPHPGRRSRRRQQHDRHARLCRLSSAPEQIAVSATGARSRTGAELVPALQPEDVYAATLIGLLGAAQAGITTVVDWSDRPSQSYVDAISSSASRLRARELFCPHRATSQANQGDRDDAIQIAYGSPDP